MAGENGDLAVLHAQSEFRDVCIWRHPGTSIGAGTIVKRQILTELVGRSEFGRANGVVRNIDAWYEAFEVGEDHELYLPPEQRVTIW